MPSLTFEKGTSIEAIDYMCDHIREIERADFEASYADVRQGLIAGASLSHTLLTASIDGVVAGIFGVALRNDGVGIPWLALTEESRAHPFHVARSAKIWAGILAKDYKRMQNLVPADDEPAIALLEFCDFTVDRSEVIHENGLDYYKFWKEEQA